MHPSSVPPPSLPAHRPTLLSRLDSQTDYRLTRGLGSVPRCDEQVARRAAATLAMLPTFSKIGSPVVDELSPHSTFGGAWGVAVSGYRAAHPVQPTQKKAELTEEEERNNLEAIARVGRLRDFSLMQAQSEWP
jgi:hypothetical protein